LRIKEQETRLTLHEHDDDDDDDDEENTICECGDLIHLFLVGSCQHWDEFFGLNKVRGIS
jgi:hypothetical protein